SPAGTTWAIGALADYATLTYTDWETAGGGNPVLNLPGKDLVVHLVAEDIYLSLKFTSLGGHFSGGFSYDRSTPAAVNNPPTVTITNPIENAVLSSSAAVTIRASATDTAGTITNVQFFDGLLSLGNDTNSPYSISASLAVGPHTLSAVASDNLGATATSAPVH